MKNSKIWSSLFLAELKYKITIGTKTRAKTDARNNDQDKLILFDDGMIVLENKKHYQLQTNCYYNWFGCWLFCQSISEHTVKKLFIFKCKITNQDYRRLCRVINRVRTIG